MGFLARGRKGVEVERCAKCDGCGLIRVTTVRPPVIGSHGSVGPSLLTVHEPLSHKISHAGWEIPRSKIRQYPGGIEACPHCAGVGLAGKAAVLPEAMADGIRAAGIKTPSERELEEEEVKMMEELNRLGAAGYMKSDYWTKTDYDHWLLTDKDWLPLAIGGYHGMGHGGFRWDRSQKKIAYPSAVQMVPAKWDKIACSMCGGTGRSGGKKCWYCDGTGAFDLRKIKEGQNRWAASLNARIDALCQNGIARKIDELNAELEGEYRIISDRDEERRERREKAGKTLPDSSLAAAGQALGNWGSAG